MAWKTGRTNIEVDFSDMSGAVANAYPAHSINRNQLADAYNALCEKRGCSRAPGLQGISALPLFDVPVRGWFIKRKKDGTEVYIAVSGGKIYNVDLSAGTKAQIGSDLTSDAECFAVNSFGVLWIFNGTDAVKIEDDLSVYRVGIVAPAGFTASATGTGTLPIGDYGVAVSYTRKVSGSAVLHSAPQIIGTKTLSGSELLRIVTTASADPQVTHITAWLTDAGGSVYYYYGETANASGNFDISSNANRNANLVMYEQAAGNQIPSGITKIYAFDGRLWGLKANSNEIYYTMKAQNVYDLEKWSTEFHIPTIPVTIISLHAVKTDLHINTSLGMFKIPNFDVTAKPLQTTNGAQSFGQILYFLEALRGTCEFNGLILGVTNDGFRFYDGEKFSIDLSQHVKPWFDKAIQNIANYPLCAIIYRRSGKRTELQLSYNDTEISVDNHNQTLVLNLDKLSINDNENYTAPWEKWGNGFAYAVVTSSNQLYVVQSMTTQSVIAIQGGQSDIMAISEVGAFKPEIVSRKIYLKTRTSIDSLMGMDIWKEIYWMAKLQGQGNGKVVIADRQNIESGVVMNRDLVPNQPILDDPVNPVILPFVLPKDSIASNRQGLKDNTAGNAVYVEIEQTSDDPTFFIYAIQLYGYHEIGGIAQ